MDVTPVGVGGTHPTMPHDRLAVLNTIADQGLISLHSHPDANVAMHVADSIRSGATLGAITELQAG